MATPAAAERDRAAKRDRAAGTAAMIAAGVMIAQQTAAKATRDALFLTSFDIARLPLMLIVAASVSIVAGLVATRVLRQVGPTRVIPAAFGVSAALLMVWWGLSFVSAGAAAVLLYIHIAALGGVLISGFWSLVTERFDPRTARLQMGRVATGATLGGFIGGVSAERVAALLGAAVMLPLLAVLHAVCAARVRSLAAGAAEHIQPDEEPGEEPGAAGPSSFSVLVGSAHLRNLAFLLITITVMATLLDYALKDYVASEWADEPDKLLRFFALFYTGASLITFLIQSLGGKWVLQRFGLSGAAASLPAAVGILGTVALFIPGVVTLVIARGMEAALRSSLFRSGYELFYTPIPADEKRATKTIIDVGADRAGDILGSVVVLALLALVPASGTYFALLGGSVLLAGVALAITRRLHTGYVASLEKSILNRAVLLDVDDIDDRVTRQTMLATIGAGELSELLAAARAEAEESAANRQALMSSRAVLDVPFEITLGARASAHPATKQQQEAKPRVVEPPYPPGLDATAPDEVRAVLRRAEPLPPAAVPRLIQLLAWDEVTRDAALARGRLAPEHTPALVECLLDLDEEFAIRRRIPVVLEHGEPEQAAHGLMEAMTDARFEVRYRAARALSRMMRQREIQPVAVTEQRVHAAVHKELGVNRSIWQGRRLLDDVDDRDDPLLSEVLARRSSRSLEHVFRLLALRPPGEPVRVAYTGLLTEDAVLRGTSLEYLETALPEDLREALWPFLDEDPGARRGSDRSAAEVRDQLLRSRQSILMSLQRLQTEEE